MSNGFKKKSSFRCRRITRKRTSFACETRCRTGNHVGSGRSGPNAPPTPEQEPPPSSAPPSSAPPSSAPRGRRDPDARLRLSGVGEHGHLPQTAGPGRFLSTPHVTAEVEGAAGLGWLPRLSLGHRHRHQDSHRDKPRWPARAPDSLPGRFKMTCSERAQGDSGFTDAAPAARAASFALHLLARVACEMSWRGSPRH